MLNTQLKNYLKKKDVRFSLITHTPAYTASQTAQAAHIPGRRMAKVVMVKLDDKLAMIAIPANEPLNLKNLKKSAQAKTVELAHEYEFSDKFKNCDAGAMPPFGDLYKMDVFLADSFRDRKWIACNAGNHSELLKIPTKEFINLLQAKRLAGC